MKKEDISNVFWPFTAYVMVTRSPLIPNVKTGYTYCYRNIDTRISTELVRGRTSVESVTLCSESRKEVTLPMPFLSPKKISKTGTWNVRTMYKSNKAAQIARKQHPCNTIVLALYETRWIQSSKWDWIQVRRNCRMAFHLSPAERESFQPRWNSHRGNQGRHRDLHRDAE